MDRTRIDGSVLGGEVVDGKDLLARQTVLIVQNYEISAQGKASFFGLCSGVVLSPNIVLTAAHCVRDKKNLRVVVTTNVHEGNDLLTRAYNITESIIHPDFVTQSIVSEDVIKLHPENDLALLWIDTLKDVFYDRAYLMAQVTQSFLKRDSLPEQLLATIVGFGRNTLMTNTGGLASEQDKKVNGILIKAAITLDPSNIEKPVFWVDQQAQPGTCSGDSGGPLYTHRSTTDPERKYLQALAIGVTYKNKKDFSPTGDCQNLALYLNLDFHKNWIRDQAGILTKKYLPQPR